MPRLTAVLLLFTLVGSTADSQVLSKSVKYLGQKHPDNPQYPVSVDLEIKFRVASPAKLSKGRNQSYVVITVQGFDEDGYVVHEDNVRDRYGNYDDVVLDQSKVINAKRISVTTSVPARIYPEIVKWDVVIEIWERK
jgi:hypothetical protein